MASVVATIALINAVIPALGKSSSSLVTANAAASDRIKTNIEIIHASGNTTAKTVTFWVKNIGTTAISDITSSDVILDTPTSVDRLTYTSGCALDCWDYTLEDGATDWVNSKTVKITIMLSSLSTGLYTVQFNSFNGVSKDKDFSI